MIERIIKLGMRNAEHQKPFSGRSICLHMKSALGSCAAVVCAAQLFATGSISGAGIDARLVNQRIDELEAELAELRAMVEGQEGGEKREIEVTRPPQGQLEEPTQSADIEPSYAVTSKSRVELYGYVKVDAFHDSGMTHTQEIPFWALPEADGNDSDFGFTAKQTRLGANIDGPNILGGDISGNVEIDFYGNVNQVGNLNQNHAYQPRSRHLFVRWSDKEWSLLAGKTWEPYILVQPATVNFASYNFAGKLGSRKAQVQVVRRIDLGANKLEITGALMNPVGGVHGADVDGDGQDDGANSARPDLVAKAVIKREMLGQEAVAGISAVYGQERIEGAGFNDNKFDMWAVTGGLTLPLSERLALKANGFIGQNLDSLRGGISQGINLTSGQEISGYGLWGQLQYQASDRVRVNIGYSIDNPKESDLNNGQRSRNQSALVNLFYDISSDLSVGLEYLRIETDYKGNAEAGVDRVASTVIYSF